MLTSNLQVTNTTDRRVKRNPRRGWRKFFLFNLPAFLWLLVIFALVSMPSSYFGTSSLFSGDKFIHALMFFILVVLSMQGFYKQQLFAHLRYEGGYYALMLGFFFSGITEILQGLVFASRSADPYDYLANTIGCILGWAFFSWVILQKRSA